MKFQLVVIKNSNKKIMGSVITLRDKGLSAKKRHENFLWDYITRFLHKTGFYTNKYI